MCKTIVIIDSENPENDNDLSMNLAATSRIIASGTGLQQFEEKFSAIDIPVFFPKFYAQLQDIVYQKWEETAAETMREAAIREKAAALAEGRLKNLKATTGHFYSGIIVYKHTLTHFRLYNTSVMVLIYIEKRNIRVYVNLFSFKKMCRRQFN